MNKEKELIRAINQVDFAYMKELLIEHQTQLISQRKTSGISYVREAVYSFKKNPKLLYELLKYPDLYSPTDGSIIYLFNEGIVDDEFLLLSNFFDFKLLSIKGFLNLANYAIINKKYKLIEYCIINDINPEEETNWDSTYLYLTYNIKDIGLDLHEKIINKISNQYDFDYLLGIFGFDFYMMVKEPVDRLFFKNASEVDFINYLFNFNTKSTRKMLYENIFNKRTKSINYQLVKLLILLKKTNFSHDAIINFVNRFRDVVKIDYDSMDILVHMINSIKKSFSEKKVLLLLGDYFKDKISDHILSDISPMLLLVRGTNINFDTRCKNFNELHDKLVVAIRKVKQQNCLFKQQEEFQAKLNPYKQELNHNLKKFDLISHIPLYNHDLIDVGQYLSICVGSGTYCEKILNNSLYIMLLKDYNGFVKYCISIHAEKNDSPFRYSMGMYSIGRSVNLYGQIEQAKGFRNESMPEPILNTLKNTLAEVFSVKLAKENTEN